MILLLLTVILLLVGIIWLLLKLKQKKLLLWGGGTITLLLILTVSTGAILNTSIQKGKVLPQLRWYFQFFFPPKDLYTDLVHHEIDIASDSSESSFSFAHIYAGKHTFGIMGEKYKFLAKEKVPFNAGIRFTFSVDQDIVWDTTVSEKYFGFSGKEGDGFALAVYEVPQKLPIDKTVTCRVRVLKADVLFHDKHEPIKIYVSKMSEE